MKTVLEHIHEMKSADRKMLTERAAQLKSDPAFRLIMDGLQADALTKLATISPVDTNMIRKWQERYQALKQIDIELGNFEAAIPKDKLRVV